MIYLDCGETAKFSDVVYENAGAEVTQNREEVYSKNIVVRVNAPDLSDLALMKEDGILIAMYMPREGDEIIQKYNFFLYLLLVRCQI